MKYGGHQKDTTEIFDNYPIELNLNRIKWKFSQDKFKNMSENMKNYITIVKHYRLNRF